MPGVASTSCSTQVLVNEHKLPHILASGPPPPAPPPPYTSRLAQSIVVLRAKQLTRSPSGASTVRMWCAMCYAVWRKFGGALSASSIRKQKLQHMQYRALAVLLPTLSTCGQSRKASVAKKKFDGGSSMALQVMQFFLQSRHAALAIFSGNTLSNIV